VVLLRGGPTLATTAPPRSRARGAAQTPRRRGAGRLGVYHPKPPRAVSDREIRGDGEPPRLQGPIAWTSAGQRSSAMAHGTSASSRRCHSSCDRDGVIRWVQRGASTTPAPTPGTRAATSSTAPREGAGGTARAHVARRSLSRSSRRSDRLAFRARESGARHAVNPHTPRENPGGFFAFGRPMSPTRTPTPPGVDLPSVPETYLKDDLAVSLMRTGRRPSGRALEALRDGAGPARRPASGCAGSRARRAGSWPLAPARDGAHGAGRHGARRGIRRSARRPRVFAGPGAILALPRARYLPTIRLASSRHHGAAPRDPGGGSPAERGGGARHGAGVLQRVPKPPGSSARS